MKLKLSHILLSIIALFAYGCSSFLEEETLSIITEDDFYKTDVDAENALNAIYINFDSEGIYGDDYLHLISLASDEGVYSGGNPDLASLSNFNFGSSNETIENVWSNFYTGISAANIVIEKVPPIVMDDARKDVILGEAYFFRGLFYSDLYRLFRSIPVVLETPFDQAESINVSQASATEVMNQIISDLQQAQSLLPQTSDTGKPNSLAASSILARTHHFSGNYSEAIAACETVINSTQYALITDINDLFRNGNNSNSEFIFSVTRSTNNEGSINLDLLPESLGGSGDFGISDMTVSLYESGDRREESFIVVENGQNFSSKYYDEINEASGGMSTVDIPVIRYAEILLIYADAENEFNSAPSTVAYQAINEVRARSRNAFVGAMLDVRSVSADLSGLDYAGFQAAVLEERQKEFLWEGSRWMDLSRANNLVAMVSAAKPSANPQTRNNIFPIPHSEIVINGWNQNDGY